MSNQMSYLVIYSIHYTIKPCNEELIDFVLFELTIVFGLGKLRFATPKPVKRVKIVTIVVY